MNAANLTVKQARAILSVAAKQDIRFYLNGVFVDFGKKRIAATNGHILIAWKSDEITGEGEAIIPRDALEAVLKGGSGYDEIAIKFENDVIAITRGANTMQVNPIDGKFPDIERLIPDACSGEPGQYQGAYLATVSAALSGLTDYNYVLTAYNGTGAAVLHCDGESAIGVVMPMRGDADLKFGETWKR